MENKATKLLKRLWTEEVTREFGSTIPDIEFEEAIKEAKQTQRAMFWYFVATVVFGVYTIADLLSPYIYK